MIYTVAWTSTAEDALAAIWNDASDRSEVSEAADRIDSILRRDPDLRVRGLSEGLYALVQEPLAVLVEIDPDDRLVLVVQVRRI